MNIEVEVRTVSFIAGRKTNFRGKLEVDEAVGVTEGVAVEESEAHAEGV